MEATVILIENEDDLKAAQYLVSSLMNSGDPIKGALLRAQGAILAAYEAKRWPMERATPAEVIQYIMEQHDLTPADMVAYLGSRSKVSEVLSGKLRPSITMIVKLRKAFNVSADALIPAI